MATGDFNAKDGKLHGRVSRGANLLAKLRGKAESNSTSEAIESQNRSVPEISGGDVGTNLAGSQKKKKGY